MSAWMAPPLTIPESAALHGYRQKAGDQSAEQGAAVYQKPVAGLSRSIYTMWKGDSVDEQFYYDPAQMTGAS